MKRTSIEFLIGWLDALRRDERATLKAMLGGDIVWQGVREAWVYRGADAVVDMLTGQRDAYGEIGAEGHAILHAHGGDVTAVEDVPLPDGISTVFAVDGGRVTRMDDFADRGAALAAAGLGAV